MVENFENLDCNQDENMILLAKNKDKSALEHIMNKYRFLVLSKSRLYFLTGATEDDLIQEGMIGLYKAIEGFDTEKKASFRTFAEICIQRQLISAVRSATRQKHQPLNTYVSINNNMENDETEQYYLEVMDENELINPEKFVIGQETNILLKEQISKSLSDFEMKVLKLYIDGGGYEEIAESLDKSTKSIDNALQRIKKKMEKILKDMTI